jgi:hypothetical protein
MMVRTLNLALALVLAASSAQAQNTGYVAPPRPPDSAQVVAAAADSARRDSLDRAMVTNMKAWVDSAAGVPAPTTVAVLDRPPSRLPPPPVEPARPLTDFSNGSVAPDTASGLPTLAILGVLFLALGSALLASHRRG